MMLRLFPARACLRLIAIMLLQLTTGVSAYALDIEKLVMPGEVIEGHAKIEADCDACHKSFSRESQNVLCSDCHTAIAADQKAGRGFHGKDKTASTAQCASCHTEHLGRGASIVNLDTASFNHKLSDFELLGKHADSNCKDCHVADVAWRDAPQACLACHKDDDQHRGALGEDCAACHTPADWSQWTFDHFADNGFALAGKHKDVTCSGCHADQHYKSTPTTCIGCHREDDVHKGLNGDDCESCHTVNNWQESLFDHGKKTSFALLGKHATASCDQCHSTRAKTMRLDSSCISCHRDDDVHKGRLGDDCADCHDAKAWQASGFKHDLRTSFPLLGKHSTAQCAACHLEAPEKVSLGTACIDCHKGDDVHAMQLGSDCADCHNESGWTLSVRFDHDFASFPLIGKHRDAVCADCHETGRYHDAPSDCSGCHSDDDIHAGRLGADCATCHNPVNWDRWRFDHLAETGFVLDGAHAEQSCTDCHRQPIAAGNHTPSRCIDCHRSDDVHNGQFGRDCGRCHYTDSFDRIRSLP